MVGKVELEDGPVSLFSLREYEGLLDGVLHAIRVKKSLHKASCLTHFCKAIPPKATCNVRFAEKHAKQLDAKKWLPGPDLLTRLRPHCTWYKASAAIMLFMLSCTCVDLAHELSAKGVLSEGYMIESALLDTEILSLFICQLCCCCKLYESGYRATILLQLWVLKTTSRAVLIGCLPLIAVGENILLSYSPKALNCFCDVLKKDIVCICITVRVYLSETLSVLRRLLLQRSESYVRCHIKSS